MICENCGYVLPEDALFCPECGTQVAREEVKPEAPKKERPLLGALGAVLGGILGILAVMVVNQMGSAGYLCGIFMGLCILTGYEMLGGRLGGKGTAAVLCVVLVAPFLADMANWARVIMVAKNTAFFPALGQIFPMLAAGEIRLLEFVQNLCMIYFFTFLGGFVALLLTVWEKKEKKHK